MEKKTPFNFNNVHSASVRKSWEDMHGPMPFCLGIECAKPKFLKNRCGYEHLSNLCIIYAILN